MLDALLKGEETPQQIAQHAQRRAKSKISEIIASLEGHQMSDRHRRMIHFHLDHMKVLEEQIAIGPLCRELGITGLGLNRYAVSGNTTVRTSSARLSSAG